MRTSTIAVVALLALTSCSRTEDKARTENEKRVQQRRQVLLQLESVYKESKLLSAYDAEILTYELQEHILQSPNIILDNFKIDDVSLGDSLWTFHLGSEWRGHGHIAELTCAEPEARAILAALDANKLVGYYAARIRSVNRIHFVATSFGTSDEYGETTSEVVFEDDPPLLLKGELLEVR
ncbi:MAG: hypothetical protein IT227_08935 [Flavobacteriales bacterium]|nr:hypothetical protein [Flavobacteriales bacterium]